MCCPDTFRPGLLQLYVWLESVSASGGRILNRFHSSCSKLPPAADASTGRDLRLGLESDVMRKNTDSDLKLKIRGLGCDCEFSS